MTGPREAALAEAVRKAKAATRNVGRVILQPPHVYDDIRADRDAQVRALKGEGLSPIAIARKIGCSPPTVREAIRRLAL